MKVKTHFKQMFLVDNVVHNKINNTPSSQVHHTTLQIPSTLNVPPAPPSSLIQPSTPSAPSKPPAPLDLSNKPIKKNLTNHMTSDNNSNQQETANMKPFEVEGNQWLDEAI